MIYEDPDVVALAVPFMLGAVLLELFLGKKKGLHRVNDSITSLTSGGLLLLGKLLPWFFFASIELAAYSAVYKRFHVVDIPLDSWLAHFIVFLGVDLGYYWAHRMSHEINIFWAGHVVHHSSNFYNLTTALRQSYFQTYNVWFYYLPMAFFLPPRIYYIQKGINTVYQFWVHTQLIPKLGPIEWIFNTPSHHRVHHARNRKYIDKNYAGVLIIWDRMFGTFEPESSDEEVVYGLVHPLTSFNPLWVQTHHIFDALKAAYNISGFTNKLSVLFKGPGWQPGKPRLGDNNDIPDIPPNQRIVEGPAIPTMVKLYTILQFITTLAVFFTVMELHQGKSSEDTMMTVMISSLASFAVISYCALGAFFDQAEYAIVLEWARLLIAAWFAQTQLFLNVFPNTRVKEGVHMVCVVSFVWLSYISYNKFSKRYPLLTRATKLVHTKNE